MAESKVRRELRSRDKWRHLVLLISLLFLFLLSPFIATHRLGAVFLNVAGAAVLFSGAFAVREKKAPLVVALLLAVISLTTNALMTWMPNRMLMLASFVSVFLLLGLFSVNILGNVLRPGSVTADKIFGAICVYLLVAYAWAFAYGVIEVAQPGSFSGLKDIGAVEHVGLVMQLRYFSFITMTTVGFGDIAPLSPVARTFCALEAVMGQMYIAVLVARLVGLHIVHHSDNAER